MHTALKKIFAGSQEGLTDTQIEFGELLSISPVEVKLDEDPAPLEEEEIVWAKNLLPLDSLDIGKRYALMRCTNGQYLVLVEV